MTTQLEKDAPELLTLAEPAAGTWFTWSCRIPVDDPGGEFVARACGAGGEDRDEYTAHFKAHGRAEPKSAFEPWRPWVPPRPVKKYAPKADAPGQPVTWAKITDGHWEGREYEEGGWGARMVSPGVWVDKQTETRTGIIWSVGTTGSELWVCPDDDPTRPVLVKRHGKKFSLDRDQGGLFEVNGFGEAARLAVLRGEAVRRRGIFPVVDQVLTGSGWGLGRTSDKRTYLKWHTDPGCPLADGKERYDQEVHGHATGFCCDDFGRRWTPLDVAAVLARGGQVPSELCAQCVTGLAVEGDDRRPGLRP